MKTLAGMACALLSVTTACAQSTNFCDKVKAVTADPTVAAAHWGIQVATLDGTSLCSVNEAQYYRPASNNKLLTLASALALLGPDHRFTTTVVADGEIKAATLHGNLRLVGGGDPGFGSQDVPYVPPAKQPKPTPPEPATIADIEELADQIVAKGIRKIEGDIVGDDTYFAWEPYPHGWMMEDLLGFDGSPVSALTIHDSAVEIDITPGTRLGAPATVTALPAIPYYKFDSEVTTTQAGGRPALDRDLGSRTLTIAGEIGLNDQPRKQRIAIHDPAEYAALALMQALERRGVKITGTYLARHQVIRTPARGRQDTAADTTIKSVLASPTAFQLNCPIPQVDPRGGTVLATHTSPPLVDDATFTAKVSQNLHAEVYLRDLGVAFSCDHTNAAAMAIVKAYLAQAAAVPSADMVLYDGSGLSGHTMLTPRALTQLLIFSAKQPWADSFKTSLPIGGVDGTLSSRFTTPGSPLSGKVFAKTGTLGESRALSGYLTTASGQTLAFSIMVDNHSPSGAADRIAMDKIVELVAAAN